MALPFPRFLNLVYFFATEDAEEKEKNSFDVRLRLPDARARATGAATREDSPWSKENEERALGGLLAQMTGGDG
jgi:hypothetical protein